MTKSGGSDGESLVLATDRQLLTFGLGQLSDEILWYYQRSLTCNNNNNNNNKTAPPPQMGVSGTPLGAFFLAAPGGLSAHCWENRKTGK
jgi:hypothetical protein